MTKFLIGLIISLLSISVIEGLIIYGKNSKIESLKAQLLIKMANEKALNASIDEQNKAIETLEIDYKGALEKFKTRPKVRYITKYITKDINVTRSNCKDVENLLSELKRIDID